MRKLVLKRDQGMCSKSQQYLSGNQLTPNLTLLTITDITKARRLETRQRSAKPGEYIEKCQNNKEPIQSGQK